MAGLRARDEFGRSGTMGALFASAGLSSIGFIATATVSALIAEDLLDSPTFSGLPNAAATLGRAAGTTVISLIMLRYGRRAGLVAGSLIASGAAVLAAGGTYLESFPLFLAALFVFGLGFGGTQLARYAAADLYPSALRSSAISWIVWAGTIGSVIGPALLSPSQEFALGVGMPGLTGAHMVAFVTLFLAGVVLWVWVRPEELPMPESSRPGLVRSFAEIRAWAMLPKVRIAILMLPVGQGVMVLLMAMTPLYIRAAGEGLGSVGIAMSAHTLGMFALSPVSGWVSDRFGRLPAVVAASVLLCLSAVLAFSAQGNQVALLSVSIFLLGLGWNLGFVAGSALLTENVPPADQVRAQGMADTLAWLSGATAAFSAGLMLSAWGFPTLALIGGMIALLPVLAVVRQRLARDAMR